MVLASLGRWHHNRYKGNKCRIKDLCGVIHEIVEGTGIERSIERLRATKEELVRLYNVEETY